MGTIASQITSLTIVYSTVYSGADQRKMASNAEMFPFDDVIMVQGMAYYLLAGLGIQTNAGIHSIAP